MSASNGIDYEYIEVGLDTVTSYFMDSFKPKKKLGVKVDKGFSKAYVDPAQGKVIFKLAIVKKEDV